MDEKSYDEILDKLWDIQQIALDAGCFARGDGYDEIDRFGEVIHKVINDWVVLKGELPR
jgi:hypothetical protein